MAWYSAAVKGIGIVKGLISIAKDLSDEHSDFSKLKYKLKEILDSIENSREQIIAELNELERRDISGGITGLVLTLRTYDRISLDEPRLLRVIDDGAQLIGRIIEVLQDSSNRSLRFEGALSMLLFTSYLRTIAMIEREKLTNGSNPEIEDLFDMYVISKFWLNEAIEGVGNIDQRVQCTGETQERGDTIMHGYRFDGDFIDASFQIWEQIDRGTHEPPLKAREEASKACADKKAQLQAKIDSYAEELRRIDDFLTVLKS